MITRIILLITLVTAAVSIVLKTIVPMMVLLFVPLLALMFAGVVAVFLTKRDENNRIIVIGIPPPDIYRLENRDVEIDGKSLN